MCDLTEGSIELDFGRCQTCVVPPEFPRPLSESERDVLTALLSFDFRGAAKLRKQVPNVQVIGMCGCGCPTIVMSVIDAPRAPKKRVSLPLPNDFQSLGSDPGAPPGWIMLFTRDGFLSGMEYYTADGEIPTRWPSPTDIKMDESSFQLPRSSKFRRRRRLFK